MTFSSDVQNLAIGEGNLPFLIDISTKSLYLLLLSVISSTPNWLQTL